MGDTVTCACCRAAAGQPPPGLLPAAPPGAAVLSLSSGPGHGRPARAGVPAWPARWRSERAAFAPGPARRLPTTGTTHEGPPGSSWGASEAAPPTPPEASAC